MRTQQQITCTLITLATIAAPLLTETASGKEYQAHQKHRGPQVYQETKIGKTTEIDTFTVPKISKDYRLDDELFRRELIRYGFDKWLELYNEEHLPEDDLDLFSEQISQAWLKYSRSEGEEKAEALNKLLELEQLRIANYPNNVLLPIWQTRYASDLLLEKGRNLIAVHLAGLSLPEKEAEEFHRILNQVKQQLDKAAEFIDRAEKKFETLQEEELNTIIKQGIPELYELTNIKIKVLKIWYYYQLSKLLWQAPAERIKLLYRLKEDINELLQVSDQKALGAELIILADVENSLGDPEEAAVVLQKAKAYISQKDMLFYTITDISINAKRGKDCSRQLTILNKLLADQHNILLELSKAKAEALVQMGAVKSSDRMDPETRNNCLKPLASIIEKQPELIEYILPWLIEISQETDLNSASDLELFAKATYAFNKGKYPLTESILRRLINRPTYLKEEAVLLLADALLVRGEKDKATELLSQYALSLSDPGAKIIRKAAELIWNELQNSPDNNNKVLQHRLVKLILTLFEKYPNEKDTDIFKLMIAGELADQGRFKEALRWINQIPPKSRYYILAHAKRVIILTKQYKSNEKISSYKDLESNARGILDALKDLYTITDLEEGEGQKLSEEEKHAVALALIYAIDTLSEKKLGEALNKEAELIRKKYASLIENYSKQSKTVATEYFYTLIEKPSQSRLKEARDIAEKLLSQKTFPEYQKLKIINDLMYATYYWWLNNFSANEVLGGEDASLIDSIAEIAEKVISESSTKRSSDLLDQLDRMAILLSILHYITRDKTAINGEKVAEGFSRSSPEYKKAELDIELLQARRKLLQRNYTEAIQKSTKLIAELSPLDIRYWQALTINLMAHLKIGSDRSQIRSAILTRKAEFPELGNKETRKTLEYILEVCSKEP